MLFIPRSLTEHHRILTLFAHRLLEENEHLREELRKTTSQTAEHNEDTIMAGESLFVPQDEVRFIYARTLTTVSHINDRVPQRGFRTCTLRNLPQLQWWFNTPNLFRQEISLTAV